MTAPPLRPLLEARRPLVAVPFTDATTDAELDAAVGAGLDVAELRIDLFASSDPDAVVAQVRRFARVPTLATIRCSAEGGGWHGSDADRLALFEHVLPEVGAVDVELSSTAILAPVVEAARAAGKVVIVSAHDFEGTPPLDDLHALVAHARAAGADLVKVATLASSRADLAALTALVLAHADEGLVAVGMGAHGPASRIFLPILGSALTYAAGPHQLVTGQLSLADTVAALRLLGPPQG